MISQASHTPPSSKDPFYYPYQRYIFGKDGGLKHLTSKKAITQEQKMLQNQSPPASFFQITSHGMMTIVRKDSKKIQPVLCTEIINAASDSNPENPRKGDILISYLTSISKPPLVQRLLRREKETP